MVMLLVRCFRVVCHPRRLVVLCSGRLTGGVLLLLSCGVAETKAVKYWHVAIVTIIVFRLKGWILAHRGRYGTHPQRRPPTVLERWCLVVALLTRVLVVVVVVV